MPRLDPSINLGQIVLALSFVGTGIGMFYGLRGDVNVHSVEIAMLKVADVQTVSRVDQVRREILDELRGLNAKLDALKERQDRSEGQR